MTMQQEIRERILGASVVKEFWKRIRKSTLAKLSTDYLKPWYAITAKIDLPGEMGTPQRNLGPLYQQLRAKTYALADPDK